MEDLGDGSKAVGGARSVGDDVHVAGVGVVVDTHHEDGGAVLGRGRDDDLLGTALGMETSSGGVTEDTSALSDIVGAGLSPRDLGGVSLLEDIDLVAVDFDAAIGLLNCAVKASWCKYDIIKKLRDI